MTKPSQPKKIIIRRAVALLAVFAMLFLIYWMFGRVQKIRKDIIETQMSLDQELTGAVYNVALQSALDERSHDLDRIRETIPTQEGLGTLVGEIESIAKRRQVSVRIPTIQKKVRKDSAGEPILVEGLLDEVELEIQVRGKPRALLEFAHEVEYLPFLMGLSTFKLEVRSEKAPLSMSSFMTSRRPPGFGASEDRVETKGELMMVLDVSSLRKGYGL